MPDAQADLIKEYFRKHEGKNIPPQIIDKLSWQAGQELESETTSDALLIKKHPKTKK